MSNDILSQDEVDALLGGVDEGAIDTEDPGEFDGEARPFDFNNQERIVRGRLPTLEMINARFVRYFRVSFFNLLRKSPEIETDGVELIKFSEYMATLGSPTSLTLVKVSPFRGTGLVVLDASLVFALDNFFGGNGSIKATTLEREFTATELRVIEKMVQLCFADLARAWKSVKPVTFSQHAHEVNPQMAHIVSPSEVVVLSRFAIDLGDTGGEIHVVYPYSMIEPIRPLLDAGVQSDHGETDARWSTLLREELMHARIDLQALFVEKQLPVSDLINFKAGDIIPIDLPEQVLVLAEDIPVMRGQYGEHQGNAAVKVEEIVAVYDPDDSGFEFPQQ